MARADANELRCLPAIRAREAEKRKHYAGLCKAGELKFYPFVFESHGYLSDTANALIDEMAAFGAELKGGDAYDKAALAGYIRRRVAVAIQRGNAGLESVAREKQRGSFGSLMARGFIQRPDGSDR